MDSSAPRNSSSPEAQLSSPVSEKRDHIRKIRRGTRSCWACKRRKVRCSLSLQPGQVCTNCKRRGSPCVGQNVPEELVPVTDDTECIGDRIVRVETLVNTLSQRVGGSAPAWDDIGSTLRQQQSIPTPSLTDGSLEETNSRPLECSTPPASEHAASNINETVWDRGDLREMSRALLSVYPTQKDVGTLPIESRDFRLHIWLRTNIASESLKQDGPFPSQLSATDLEPLTINTHPVLIAHQMLSFVTQLQQCSYFEGKAVFEAMRTTVDRLMKAVIALVTTNEAFHGTAESLQCIVMEAIYLLIKGSLQQSWRAIRRAMLAAQQMGVHNPCNRNFKTLDPRTELNREVIWFRMLYFDRHICLVLGLPQGSTDTSMASGPAMTNDQPLGRLDRAHAAIAERLLERLDRRDLSAEEESTTTQAIDAELLRAAEDMPIKFWLQPNFHNNAVHAKQDFQETWRNISQVCHYNLINQLYLPQLVRFKADGSGDHAKLACMNANREVLTRYVSFRNTKTRNGSCLTFDFLTVMAGITLLLAHLDSHLHKHVRSPRVLEHQRLCDRTSLEQVLDTIETVYGFTNDPMCESGIKMLRCLLRIEQDAAEGARYNAQCVQQPGLSQHWDEKDHEGQLESGLVLRICIPYFGLIKIAREGSRPAVSEPLPALQGNEELETTLPTEAGLGHHLESPALQTQARSVGEQTPNPVSEQDLVASFSINGHEEFPLQQYWNPGLMTGADDWIFQGVDLDYFDTR